MPVSSNLLVLVSFEIKKDNEGFVSSSIFSCFTTFCITLFTKFLGTKLQYIENDNTKLASFLYLSTVLRGVLEAGWDANK